MEQPLTDSAPGARPQEAPYGLLGRTLGHSWSPQIHKRLGSAPYLLIELEPDELEPYVRSGRWRGLNVTIPYKREAAELADEQSPRVQRVGAANTLVRRPDGTVFAENTDVLGFSWMLERFARRAWGTPAAEVLAGAEALVLGSGGASRAVIDVLEQTGCRAAVISRSGSDTYATIAERHPRAVLVVNTTPVGMYPHCPDSPLAPQTLERLPRLRGVLDVVYNPRRTGLCLAAEKLGIPCESGLAMLVSQARFSSELFQGRSLDDALVEQIAEELHCQTQNIVLIGMPGAGKTSCGRRLARALGRPLVDLDQACAEKSGMPAPDYLHRFGEEAFRTLETEVAREQGARSGLVIACGGGIVTRERNYPLLHQNGAIVLLDRPLGELSSAGRPLSQSRGVDRLAAERMPAYRAWADLAISCTGSAEGDAQAILQKLGYE